VNDTYIDMAGRLWYLESVTEDRVVLKDPYGFEKDRDIPKHVFALAINLDFFNLAWTAEESKNWK
jgi:hypothetical protein